MKNTNTSSSVRRSVALPGRLVQDALDAAPADLKNNLNRLVVVALQEFVERRRQSEFENAMAGMASDPDLVDECQAIGDGLGHAETDGLPRAPRARKRRSA